MKPLDLSNFINLDAILAKPSRSRIALVGIELEGAWRKLPNGTRLIRDGSLDRWECPPDVPDRRTHQGELPSPPLDPKDVSMFMKTFYPHYVHESCGMHVHMSFKNALCYSRCMDERYPSTVVHYLKQWAEEEKFPSKHHFWDRLNGKSPYCQLYYQAEEQIKNTMKDHDQRRQGHRYTFIAYHYARFGTIECRGLPMMETVEQAIRGVQRLQDITNGYLVATAKKEPWLSASMVVSDEVKAQERRLVLS